MIASRASCMNAYRPGQHARISTFEGRRGASAEAPVGFQAFAPSAAG